MRQLTYHTDIYKHERKFMWQYAAIPEPNVPQVEWLVTNAFSTKHPDNDTDNDTDNVVAVFSLKRDKWKEARTFSEFRATHRTMTVEEFEKRYGVDDGLTASTIECVHVYMGGLYLYQFKYRRPHKFWMPLENDDPASDIITELELLLYDYQRSYNQDDKVDIIFHAKIRWLIKLAKLAAASNELTEEWGKLQDETDSDDSTAEHYPFNLSFDDHAHNVREYLKHQLSLI